MAEEIFDISDKALKHIEETFWRSVRIRYCLRREKNSLISRACNSTTLNDDYDIELLLNTAQILKSEINQLEKRIAKLEAIKKVNP
jgi:hypothetical protein